MADEEFVYPGEYECDKCGACCAGHLIVEVGGLDVLREPKLFDAGWRKDKPTMKELWDDEKCIRLGRFGDHRCSFLGGDNLCTIYPTRPDACVSMQAGDRRCQESRAAAGLDPLKRVSETQ